MEPLDLDILLFGDEIIDEPELKIPHVGIAERSFVLWPLLELDPTLGIPGVSPVAELRTAVEANPDDLQARFDLAQALHANDQAADAVDELLEIFRRDQEWNEGAAKTQMFTIFDALKPNDPIVLNGRRKLSSIIFA